MRRISGIGSLLKKIYRIYSAELLNRLQKRGFTDLRPSFLEILTFVTEDEGASIKEIGLACGLKKQTMTSHLNELESRGYIARKAGHKDRREQKVYLTKYGEKFKFSLLEAASELEQEYSNCVGEVELDRVHFLLENFHRELKGFREEQPQLL